MTTSTFALPFRSIAAGAAGLFTALVERLLTWQERAAERHYVRNLGDHELRDLGLSRADLEREYAKPFWRP
jgi:uncharacterized protein YjiS (DUF1127 family)